MPRPLPLPLPLPPPVPRPIAAAERPHSKEAGPKLWAAIHLPALPLEALDIPADAAQPVAVIEDDTTQAGVIAASAGAFAAGIRVGMRAGAAAARCASLELRIREPASEAAALERLAAWGAGFTSVVSLEAPDALLLEVGGSLRLFGGEARLHDRLRTELATLGHAASIALTPTPRASLWLARDHVDTVCTDRLSGRLGELPATALRLPERTARDLERLGVQTLREIFRLPRDGLARRFGPALLIDWDRALGRVPEARRHWQSERRFNSKRELPAAVREIGLIKPYIECLVAKLAVMLRRHDAGIDSLTLTFIHERLVPPTELRLRLLAVSRDAARFRRLLDTRLERVSLPAPAMAIRLESGAFKAFTVQTAALIEDRAAPAAEMKTLIETLRARLGREAVFSQRPVADHRPERAWRRAEPAAPAASCDAPPRPVWLLPEPALLGEHDGVPLHQGRHLTFTGGPERIESGWFDGNDICRDYYVARTAGNARLWIFHDRRARRWYLHGYFA